MMKQEVVITGFDVISPIGIGQEEFWDSLFAGKSGIRPFDSDIPDWKNRPLTGAVGDFHPKDFVRPKKNIKVMSRDIQIGFVSSSMAVSRAKLDVGTEEGAPRSVDPERLGVVFGCDLIGIDLAEVADAFRAGMKDGHHDFSTWGKMAMEKIMPLWMLKYLPNMPASHISIALDARAASNSPTVDRCASLTSIIEAVTVIQRGAADVIICGGCGNRANLPFLARSKSYNLAPWSSDPDRVPRPFDADRCGTVLGEGGGAFVLERKEFALARGAKPLATIRGFARTVAPTYEMATQSESVARAIRLTLESSGATAADIDHVNADGLGTIKDDLAEARGIHESLGDVPVFAAKGFFGNLGSGTGAVELAASLMAMEKGSVPSTRNCDTIAEDCPINVIHGGRKEVAKPAFITLNQTNLGRCCALMIEKI